MTGPGEQLQRETRPTLQLLVFVPLPLRKQGQGASVGSPHRSGVTVRPRRGRAWEKKYEKPLLRLAALLRSLFLTPHRCVSPSQPRHSSPLPSLSCVPQPSPLLLSSPSSCPSVWSGAGLRRAQICAGSLCAQGGISPSPQTDSHTPTPRPSPVVTMVTTVFPAAKGSSVLRSHICRASA